MTPEVKRTSLARRMLHRALVLSGAAAFTVMFFLVLPILQAISRSPAKEREVEVSVAAPPPPDAPPEEEPEEEPEPEEPPPELLEDSEPLDLAELELALGAGVGSNWMAGDFAVKLKVIGGDAANEDALFALSDLDQPPQATYQPNPMVDDRMRRKLPGKVVILFIVDERGRVQNPIARNPSDPVFERAAMTAIKKWRFEPGKRNGKPVRFRMRQQFTFPKG